MSDIFNPQRFSLSSYQQPARSGIAGIDAPLAGLERFRADSGDSPVGDSTQFDDEGYSFGDWAKGIGGAVQLYGGLQQQDLARQQLDFSKSSFNTNLANQAQLINNEMEARQRARLETSGKYAGQPGGQASLQSDLQSYLQPRQVSGKAI